VTLNDTDYDIIDPGFVGRFIDVWVAAYNAHAPPRILASCSPTSAEYAGLADCGVGPQTSTVGSWR